MLRSIVFAAAIAMTFTNATFARDLLSAPNPARVLVKPAALVERTLPEPFTTTPGRSSHVCTISGLGRQPVCQMLTWAERRAVIARRYALS